MALKAKRTPPRLKYRVVGGILQREFKGRVTACVMCNAHTMAVWGEFREGEDGEVIRFPVCLKHANIETPQKVGVILDKLKAGTDGTGRNQS
jgi:hypothetical protein